MLNSALSGAALIASVGILLLRQPLPQRASLMIAQIAEISHGDNLSRVDIARIYENDLFGTYVRPTPEQQLAQEEKFEIPPPPVPKQAEQYVAPAPQFLPPLEITLKGVIYTTNERENRAIISDKQSGKEELFRVGDHVLDADLIKIAKNKVIFLRSNGQQEVVYLATSDAQKDRRFPRALQWDALVKKNDDGTLSVNPQAFRKEVKNLAHFVDMLDLTTAFDHGSSIGCKVGNITTKSLGTALGFERGDVVTTIQSIPTTTTKERVAIYKSVLEMTEGAEIVVEILRNNAPTTLRYKIETFSEPEEDEDSGPTFGNLSPHGQSNQKQAMHVYRTGTSPESRTVVAEASKFDRTVAKVRQQDRQAMMKYASKRNVLHNVPS